MIDGHCEVVGPNEMMEKEGLKVENSAGHAQNSEPMFMKLKIARVVLYKKHYDFSLREIIERKRAISMEQPQPQQPPQVPVQPPIQQAAPQSNQNELIEQLVQQ